MANIVPYFKGKRAANQANPNGTFGVFAQSDASTKAVVLPMAVDSGATSAAFRIRARGRSTTGGSITWQVKFQYTTDVTSANAATAANNTDFFTSQARTVSTATRYWELDCRVYWDSTSQRLTGQSNGFVSETIETASASITALTGIDLTTRKTGFVIAGVFGTSNTSNVGTLDDCSIEVL